jgi:hypothetical protein
MSVLRWGRCSMKFALTTQVVMPVFASLAQRLLPEDACALHEDELNLQPDEPGSQSASVALQAAGRLTVLVHRAVGLLDEHSDHMQHAVHIDTGHTPAQG